MAPSLIADRSSKDTDATALPKANGKTLLLCPPSISSNPTILEHTLAMHDRASTDVQMLDRIVMGLVKLPSSTYSKIILLPDPSVSKDTPINPATMKLVAAAMAPGSRWEAQDREHSSLKATDKLQVMLAGLVIEDDGKSDITFVKPSYTSAVAVPLKLGKSTFETTESKTPLADMNNVKSPITNGGASLNSASNGYKVGFVDFGDDLNEDFGEEDDELIDENELLDESDLSLPVQPPPECQPKAGKRRRACKDCTCGLKEKLDEEDAAKRATADAALGVAQKTQAVKLDGNDLAEVDFTVEGKASSCGNCYLGDAFRCDGCPYIGLPAFKPGEQIQVPLGDDQF